MTEGFPRILGDHGPVCIPFVDMAGRMDGHPHHPGIYGRYIVIDLDANNRHAIEHSRKVFKETHPGEPLPPMPYFGWGVCRHGFGLQDLPRGMDRPTAERIAKALNDSIPIGVIETSIEARERFKRVAQEQECICV